MRRTSIAACAASLAILGLFPDAGQAQTREPEFPPPSITEYQPRSTLVVPEHPVPRARFPVVDFHGHPPTLSSIENIERVITAMDSLNIQVMVQARPSSGERLTSQIEAVRAAGYADRFVFFASLNLRDISPGSGAAIAAQLEEDVRAGAVGIGEIGKSFGLFTLKADGTRLEMDDPELDIVWETAARLGIPVFIHTGDPAEFFQPLDFENERWLEMALFQRRRFNDRERFQSFDDLMAERDRLLAKHPNTTWVLAHLSWYGNDLARLGKIFDEHPNVHAEAGAILYDLARQPRFAREFFTKYQDRILFGKDSFRPDEYPYYWRVFETADEYFDYYRDYHAFWKLYGMDLPDEVLQKVYSGNAARIIPRMPDIPEPGEKPNEEDMSQAEHDRRVDYVEFATTDIEQTKRFYSEVFGWEFTDYGPEYTSFTDGRLGGGFTVAPEVVAGGPLIVLYATNLEEIATQVLESGGQIVKEIFEFPGGRRFHFADPSGNELAVWSDQS